MTEDLRTYKEQHEAFVSNLQGSSVFEVLACVSQVPAFIMLLKLVQRNSKPSIIRDFLLFTLPTLLSITLFANLNYWSLLVLVVGLGYYHSRDRNRITQPSTPPTTPLNPSNLGETDDTSYLTLFKGEFLLSYAVRFLISRRRECCSHVSSDSRHRLQSIPSKLRKD